MSALSFLCVLCLFFTASCSPAEWEAKIEKKTVLVWPPAPNPVKAEYQGELTAFVQSGTSLANIIIGKNEETGVLKKPVAIAVARDGRMAIADLKAQGVFFFVPQKKTLQVLYKTDKGDLESPVGVAFDKNLNLYVSDSLLNIIAVYDEAGNFIKKLEYAGKEPFGRPTGLVFDNQRDLLFVADTASHNIHVFHAAKGYQHSLGIRGSQKGEFNFPTHIALDGQHKLFVNDTMNFRVQIFTRDETFADQFGHHGNGSGDFAMPKGLAVDKWGVVYVVDNLFDTIQLFDERGNFLLNIGSRGTGPGELWLPSGLFIDDQDRLYVCDTYNNRIQLFQLYNFNKAGET
jgi:DNA-binding beta-propeller fold protein YncE